MKIKINDISIFKMGWGLAPSPGIFGKQFLKCMFTQLTVNYITLRSLTFLDLIMT